MWKILSQFLSVEWRCAIIISVFTKKYGKVSGIVYGGTSRKIKNYLQIGNQLFVNYNSKSENRIGTHLIKEARGCKNITSYWVKCSPRWAKSEEVGTYRGWRAARRQKHCHYTSVPTPFPCQPANSGEISAPFWSNCSDPVSGVTSENWVNKKNKKWNYGFFNWNW